MTPKKTQDWRKVLPKRIGELRRRVEKEVTKRWEEATDMLPPAPRKALKRFTADVDRMRHDVVKRGDKFATDMRKRAERAGTDLQKRIEGVVTPLTHRLDVASRADVDRLRKRLHELERRMESRGHAPAA
ncbi:MAG TPA: phasin family protein [Candidatus Margulisiibacteriota bacterium]|nr:phasin family protein [Candidatus Margulisiibacteriota bacterium]